MKRHWLIAIIAVLLAVEPALADSLPLNQLPMFGERVKNDAMKNADAEFIASFEKQGFSREEGAKQVIQYAWSYWKKKRYSHLDKAI